MSDCKKFTPPEEWAPASDGRDQAHVWEGPYQGDWIWFEDKWQRLTDELQTKIRKYWEDILGKESLDDILGVL